MERELRDDLEENGSAIYWKAIEKGDEGLQETKRKARGKKKRLKTFHPLACIKYKLCLQKKKKMGAFYRD
jgi:hypothetical protein